MSHFCKGGCNLKQQLLMMTAYGSRHWCTARERLDSLLQAHSSPVITVWLRDGSQTKQWVSVAEVTWVLQGELNTSQAADKLSDQIAGAPDKVSEFVNKLAASGQQAASGSGNSEE